MTVRDSDQVRYVIVSPVKDEERYVELTLRSLIEQTVKPVRWVIVDDGSSDNTPRILERYAANHDWIQVVRIERDSKRDLGITEIRAFATGYERVKNLPCDFIVKLDCDLRIPPDYFERVFAGFRDNERLGIASGVFLEDHGGRWLPAHMPVYHAAGASKVVRRRCFEDIGGFVLYRGWDTIDEIKAGMKGWETRHFPDVTFYHLRREGSAMGFRRTNMLHGEIYYLTGGGAVFFLLKVLHRMGSGIPPVLGGLAMLWGYLKCHLGGRSRGVSREEARAYRQLLNRRVRNQIWRLFGRARATEGVWSHE
jgi:glycosyltransferase involved in cell wall biosynthesis